MRAASRRRLDRRRSQQRAASVAPEHGRDATRGRSLGSARVPQRAADPEADRDRAADEPDPPRRRRFGRRGGGDCATGGLPELRRRAGSPTGAAATAARDRRRHVLRSATSAAAPPACRSTSARTSGGCVSSAAEHAGAAPSRSSRMCANRCVGILLEAACRISASRRGSISPPPGVWRGGTGMLGEVLAHVLAERAAAEHRLAAEQLVHDRAERVDVAARVDRHAAGLLGRHVRGRADHRAGRGLEPDVLVVAVEELRDAEVEQLDELGAVGGRHDDRRCRA